jgi:dihydroxyacid dehydratase/phosphogluconate dehydratase
MKLQSHTITQGRDRAPARAMLKAIGFNDEDLAKPIIGVANTWIETMPCNYNLRELAVRVKEGIRAAGGTPMEFNTIAISDGVTMGTEGMKASLVSREVIADSIELLVRGHMFDGVVALVACDKTIPAAAMALLRLNIPGVVLYGGSILPGKHKGCRRQRPRPHVRCRTARYRRPRLPRCGRVRRSVHREHDGHRHGVDRARAHGHRGHSPSRLAQRRSGVSLRPGHHGRSPQ